MLSSATAAVRVGELPTAQARARAAATWCGGATREDLTPNAVAGNPVHWIYAFPSDGQDRMADLGSAMQTDAEVIDAWWRSQDSTRVPRNDLAPFACGVQIDLTTLRMQRSGFVLATDGLFGDIFNELAGAGFRSSFTKYVVYYDGPVATDRICGQGGSDSSGFGLAVVYVQACEGVSTAAVAAHELLHTLGAVPSGAPHECAEPNDSHTCDDRDDIMHPFIDESPLSTKSLDPGRDDYYGHSGGFTDTRDAAWLVRLDGQVPFELAITGPGRVQADVPGLDCAQTCTTTWNEGTSLTLSGVPADGAKLVRWGGACAGASVCSLSIAPGTTTSALFAPLSYRLSVAITGRGTVRNSAARLTCRPRCSVSAPSYVPLRLAASAAKGWRFRSWRGACSGSRPTCTVPMSAPTSARAVFVRR